MSIEVTDSVTKHSLSYALVRRTGNITSEFAGTKTYFTVLAKLDLTACFCSLHVNFPACVIVLVWKSITACWSLKNPSLGLMNDDHPIHENPVQMRGFLELP